MSSTNEKHETTTTEKSLLEAVFSVGSAWAAFGLNVGKLALQESARTLETTAGKLSTLAETLEAKKKVVVADAAAASIEKTS